MANSNIEQAASDFFYAFDNYTMWSMNIPPDQVADSQAMQAAFGSIFSHFGGGTGVYALFRNSYAADPGLSNFRSAMLPFSAQLALVQSDTYKLLQQYLEGASPNLGETIQGAFELFGQGTMYDTRRKTAAYHYWTIHGMDSRYPGNPPIGYYTWYPFIRAYSLTSGDQGPGVLHLARCSTLAAAIQNLMKPAGVSGPTPENPNNQPIDPEDLASLQGTYMNLSLAELDWLFASAQANSPLGPPPSTGRSIG